MKLDVYRYLYLANRGLLQAATALAELSKEPGFSRSRLRRTQAMIEETRAWMNSDLAEWIEQHETDRAARLDAERWKREKKEGAQDVQPVARRQKGDGKMGVGTKKGKS
jgi:hypothetical protein